MGRPRGSKNRAKTPSTADALDSPRTTTAPLPTDITSLLKYQHAELAQLEQDDIPSPNQ
jgi:hypothetical protein